MREVTTDNIAERLLTVLKATYQIVNAERTQAQSAGGPFRARDSGPVGRLQARLDLVLREIRYVALSGQTRDDLLLALPVLLAADGATRNQALVLRVLAAAGGQLSHAELRRRLNAQGMSRLARHLAVKALVNAGRIELVEPSPSGDRVGDAGGSRSNSR